MSLEKIHIAPQRCYGRTHHPFGPDFINFLSHGLIVTKNVKNICIIEKSNSLANNNTRNRPFFVQNFETQTFFFSLPNVSIIIRRYDWAENRTGLPCKKALIRLTIILTGPRWHGSESHSRRIECRSSR